MRHCTVKMLGKKKARMELYGEIGPAWAGMIDAKTVADQLRLAEGAEEIELHINSPGGSAWDGLSIYNQLRDNPAKINVVVDGVAASAASLVAMAGDNVRIPANAMLMIHNPYTIAFGGEPEMQAALNGLAATKEASIATYAAKSGKTPEEISQWMDDETYFVGQAAVDAGFADTVEAAVEVPNKVMESARVPYAKAPPQFYQLAMRAMPKEIEMATQPAETTQTPPEAPQAPVVPTAPALSAADVKAAADAAVKQERERIASITTICQQAGEPTMAAEFVSNGASVEDVQKRMFEVLCSKRVPLGETSTQDEPSGPNAKYEKEYKADPSMAAKYTLEQYIQSRRIDDGLEPLVTYKNKR
jgi:ATP-dependent protease ClpP protease subunit